jgi:hypothetical protein
MSDEQVCNLLKWCSQCGSKGECNNQGELPREMEISQ